MKKLRATAAKIGQNFLAKIGLPSGPSFKKWGENPDPDEEIRREYTKKALIFVEQVAVIGSNMVELRSVRLKDLLPLSSQSSVARQ